MAALAGCLTVTSVLEKKWHGVLALIWLPCGFAVLWLIERLLDPLFEEYFAVMWIIGGWLLPIFVMAVSGIRNGNIASRVCGALALLALAAPIIFIIYAGFTLSGH
jgi:hypothetical protein